MVVYPVKKLLRLVRTVQFLLKFAVGVLIFFQGSVNGVDDAAAVTAEQFVCLPTYGVILAVCKVAGAGTSANGTYMRCIFILHTAKIIHAGGACQEFGRKNVMISPIIFTSSERKMYICSEFENNYANMRNKNDRLEAIRQIVSEADVKNQEQLMQFLSDKGYSVTQATLSRDLKKMKISKVANTYGEYIYVLPNHALMKRAKDSAVPVSQPRYGFVSLNFSGNMAVIKTKPGYAASLAYDIDNSDIPGVLGTIAGDDTLLMILSEDASRQEVKHILEPIIISL